MDQIYEIQKGIASNKAEIASCKADLAAAKDGEIQLQETFNKLQEKEILLLKRKSQSGNAGSGSDNVDCTDLKNALINARVEDGFLCLPDDMQYPAAKGRNSLDPIPSKLLVRPFHSEMKLIIQLLRSERGRGAVFCGPLGTGKSYASMALLVDELLDSFRSGGNHRTIVYYSASSSRAYVFSKHRSVIIKNMDFPNESHIPELNDHNTVLICDVSAYNQANLPLYSCEYYIFTSPNARNHVQVMRECELETFICPNWTRDELLALGHGYKDKVTSEEIMERYDLVGGYPRHVLAMKVKDTVAAQLADDASVLLSGNAYWLLKSASKHAWPSRLLQAKYETNEVATTPTEAYNKYHGLHVTWDFSCRNALNVVYDNYQKLEEAKKIDVESILRICPEAAAVYGRLFEHKLCDFFKTSTAGDIEYKALEKNESVTKEEQLLVDDILGKVNRSTTWKYPNIKRVEDVRLGVVSKGGDYIAELTKLNDKNVMYRLPSSYFPLIDFYNPPNNCFSVGVGVGKHTLSLKHALRLCEVIPSGQINLIYVTPTKFYPEVKRWQSFTKGGKEFVFGRLSKSHMTSLNRIVQFCMKFKK